MKLSKRLQAIADLIIKYKQGEILADMVLSDGGDIILKEIYS